MRKILITGINGFVGRNCKKFFQENNEIFGIDIYGSPANNVVICNVTKDNLTKFNQKFDLIIHLAGSATVSAAIKNPELEKEKAVNSTKEVLEYIKSYNPEARLIFASSASVYGNSYKDKIKEDEELVPVSLYGEHKLEAENLCKEYSKNYGLDIKVIRFFSLYGVGNKKQLMYDILERIKSSRSKKLKCYGTGKEKRDFINVTDAVRFIDIVSKVEKKYDVYNCGSGKAFTVKDITQLLIKYSGKNIKQAYDNKKRLGNPDVLLADISKAESIGFKPEIDIEDGIKEYVEYYKNIYKVYFPIYTSEQWLGGVNYYKNLFQAINMLDEQPLEIYIPKDNSDVLFKYAKAFKIPKKDFEYKYAKVSTIIKGKKFDKIKYFANKQIDIVSHTNSFDYNLPMISWISDFQHIYLQEFFKQHELKMRDEYFTECAKNSSVVILSSNCAKNDFIKTFPEYENKAKVLKFVSYINPEIYKTTDREKDVIINKFNIPQKYFYVPNQFWQHKNHITVFKAVKLLKERGINVNVVCSGNKSDYRNTSFYDDVILKYINENNLKENIQILGIINLNEVYYLMRNCVSLINPSLFEGWSSSVEEAKSLGKNIILSDLDVHKEQNPPRARFFGKLNYEELADIMEDNWNNLNSGPDFDLEKLSRDNMDKRMEEFGRNYFNIVKEIVEKEKGKNNG